MIDITLEVEDALFRIKDLYDRSNGNCVISFSGGKDSTVVAELYLIAKERGMVGNIPIVFADTQVEYDAIYDFVKWFSKNKQDVEYIKPRLPFGKVLEKYGKPIISKSKSSTLMNWHNNIGEADFEEMGCFYKIIYGKTRTGKKYNHFKIANKHFHITHPDNEIKIHNMCCKYVKKYPFEDYYIEHGTEGFITGIRTSEGGIRSLQYKSCTSVKHVKDREIVHKMPIFDWSDEVIEEFIEQYQVELSRAYTEYGLDRTGCIGCPFAKDIDKNLEVLFKFEPKKYKAVMNWLSDVYIQQEVILPFDPNYMEKYYEMEPIIAARRYEMLLKYRPEIAHKWEKTQMKLDLGDDD